MSALFLVRHGESEWNREGRIQGQAESPLTERGIEQAHVIGGHLRTVLAGQRLDVYASPLSRAVQTAAVICVHLEHPVSEIRRDNRISDFNLGVLSGYRGWALVERDYPELARTRLEDPHAFHPPGGESGAEVMHRVGQFLADLPADGATLVVCHGVINKFIRSVRRGITGPGIIALGEGQYTVYRLDGVQESEIELRAQLQVPT